MPPPTTSPSPASRLAGKGEEEEEEDISTYLRSLPPALMHALLAQPPTSVAMLRLLSPIAQTIVMRLLYLAPSSSPEMEAEPMCQADMECWFTQVPGGASTGSVLTRALQELASYHLLVPAPTGAPTAVQLEPVFQRALQTWLLLGTGKAEGETVAEEALAVAPEELDVHATTTWDAVLQFLVGGLDSTARPGAMMRLLEAAGLMAPSPGSSADGEDGEEPDMIITSQGFRFLLQDMQSQIWTLILQYLRMVERLNMRLVDVLHFLFRLGTLEPGIPCSVASLTPTQSRMLEDLAGFGILYTRKGYFYPTRLAACLTAGRRGSWSHFVDIEDSRGYILVETNFRVYAYTHSPLKVAILGLFVDLHTKFPNMVTGIINRASIRRALGSGITAQQLLGYLTSHAHPAMASGGGSGGPMLPGTVVDQILLWESEKNRLTLVDGHLYQGFLSREEYQQALAYGETFGWIAWQDPASLTFFVRGAEGHEQLKSFLQRRKPA